MDVPESWLVAAVEAVYDLDNIRLEDLGDQPTLFATYELEALLVTGHCRYAAEGAVHVSARFPSAPLPQAACPRRYSTALATRSRGLTSLVRVDLASATRDASRRRGGFPDMLTNSPTAD
jgi:hypothetical protein